MSGPMTGHLSQLLQSGGGAWFHPLTMAAELPQPIRDSVDDLARFAILHENVHYIQAVSTLFGLMRLQGVWSSISEFATHLARGEPSAEGLADRHADRIELLSHLARPTVYQLTEPADEGLTLCQLGEDRVPGWIKAGPEGESLLYPLGATALQEGMAFAVELWHGRDEADFQMASTAHGRDFLYAAPAVALQAATGWSGRDLWGAVISTCDCALDHPTPGLAFMLAILEVNHLWPNDPPDQPGMIHGPLRMALSSPETEDVRHRGLAWLDRLAANAKDSADPFDRGILSIFRRVIEAQAIRRDAPSAFCDAMLAPNQGQDLLTRFFLPTYRAGGAMYDLGDAELSEGARLMEAAIHRLHTHLEAWPPECPFLDLSVCPEARCESCISAPWTRPPLGDTTCLYGFAAHALEHPSAPRAP